MRYYWRKTGTQMVLYDEDAADTLKIAVSIRMAEQPADPPEANYVAALRQAGETVTTSSKDFRYRPL